MTPNEPIPNLPLIRKIRDHIDAHPEEWRQESFAMSTPRAVRDRAYYQKLLDDIEDGTNRTSYVYDQHELDAIAHEILQLDIIINSCGTAFCIAGHAVSMTQGTVERGNGEIVPASALTNRLPTPFDWSDLARDALGITQGEANDLFRGSNTREDIEAQMTQIAARAGERL